MSSLPRSRSPRAAKRVPRTPRGPAGALAALALALTPACADEEPSSNAPEPVPDTPCRRALNAAPSSTCDAPQLAARPPALDAPVRAASGLEAQVESLLSFYCGECHGRCEGRVEGGLSAVDDVAALLDAGWLVPGDALGSPLLAPLLTSDAEVPRHDPVGLACEDPRVSPPWPSTGELELLSGFVDALPAAAAGRCARPPRSLERDHALLAGDVSAQPEEDRPFLRYLSLSHRLGAGDCEPALELWRSAASELPNLLSSQEDAAAPVAIDAERTLYRLDLRDYGWNRVVTVDGQTHSDWWAALSSLSPYGLAYAGAEAEALRAATGSDVPWLRVDALLAAALPSDVYYALLEIPETLDELTLGVLGIDVEANLDQELLVRAGYSAWHGERLLERHDIEVRRGTYYRLYDLGHPEPGSFSAFEREYTVEYVEAKTEIMYSLPNGLFAFAEYDAAGRRAAAAPARSDPMANGRAAQAGLACLSCHGTGLLMLRDQVMSHWSQTNPGDLHPDHTSRVIDIYRRYPEMLRILEEENQVFQDARERSGSIPGANDPVADLYRHGSGDLGLTGLAAELRVSEEALRAASERLPEPLRDLVDGRRDSVPRALLDQTYANAMCALHGGEGRPRDCSPP